MPAMNWSVMLSTRVPLALLYALQIVHGLLDADVNLRPELTSKGQLFVLSLNQLHFKI